MGSWQRCFRALDWVSVAALSFSYTVTRGRGNKLLGKVARVCLEVAF